jgi:protease-4
MRADKVLRVIGATALVLLVSTILAMAVSALSDWWGLLILLGAAVIAVIGVTVTRRWVHRNTVIEIDLEGGVIETTGSDPVARVLRRDSVAARDVVEALTKGAGDERVVGLVVRLGNGGIDLAHAQEIRDAVHHFRDSGKKAIAYAEAFGESRSATVDFYLASAFSEIYLQPKGLASVGGLLARSTFVRGLFDKLDLVPDFDHRKEYKAAKYRLTETGFTGPHREALETVAGEQFSQIMEGVSEDRGLPPDELQRLVDTAPHTADEALEAGLVDHLGYRDEAYEAAGANGSRHIFHDRYLKKAGRPHRRGPRVALIYGTGSIARGRSRFDPMTGGPSLGADDVAKAFREATDDDKVRAIVFRVDSPGGSAVASEVVSHEVSRAIESGKPVVVSMANVAGSGGYWISVEASRIVAEPGTVTGSIGVVWGKLSTREAWRRLGITFDQVALGQNATFDAPQDVFSESERARLTGLIEDIYDNFVAGVAAGRGLTPEAVEKIAKGRIWTGTQALEHGLVDELGGLETAIASAKGLAGIDPGDGVRLVVFPRERSLPVPESKEGSDPIDSMVGPLLAAMSSVRDAHAGAQARMPWVHVD